MWSRSLARVRQSWLPERTPLFGLDGVNGFVVLAVVFFLSCGAQTFFAWTTLREEALETFRQPCLFRWIEYAVTSPLQVALVASCVLVRDVQTIGLLVAAQTACVLLGFAVEYAHASGELDDPLEIAHLARKTNSPTLAAGPLALELRVGTCVCGPRPDSARMCTHERRAARAWDVSFVSAAGLHVAVWSVLVWQLAGVEAASACDAGGREEWKGALRLVVAGQCALFSCFGLVPLAQRGLLWTNDVGVEATLVYGSVAYAVLGVVAKGMLGASYVAFVELFPFA